MTDDDFAPEDFAPPGHTWTKDDELARMEHRKALAAPPTKLMRKQPHVT